MPDLLVVGATGLGGAVTALEAARRGWSVRALVRSTEVGPLTDAGAEVVHGDVTDRTSLVNAMRGADAVANFAAVLGGTWTTSPPEQMWKVNHDGALNVLDAAAEAGVRRCVHVDSNSIWRSDETMTEDGPLLLPGPPDSPYVRAKRAAYAGAVHRMTRGQDIVFVTPGAIYGPGPFPKRVLDPTSFTRVALRAIRGELNAYITFPMAWTYAPDLAAVVLGAIQHGERGNRYLAMGQPEEVSSLAEFGNEAAQIAGVDARVREIDPRADDAPDVGSMSQFAVRSYADPLFDDTRTRTRLGVEPAARSLALRHTVDWLRKLGEF